MTQQAKQTNTDQEELQIDLVALAKYLLSRWFYVFLATAISAMIAFTYTVQCIAPLYSSGASLYVNNGRLSLSGTSFGIDSVDLMASRSLVETYIVILRDRQTLEEVIEKADLPYSYYQLDGMISASAINETEVLRVTVTSPDPLEAATIANAIVEVLPKRITQIIDGCNVSLVSGAIPNTSPVFPNVRGNTMKGALVGFVLCAGVFVLMFLLDTQIHSEDYLVTTYPDVPILTAIPTMDGSDGDGYGYGSYGASGNHKNTKKK